MRVATQHNHVKFKRRLATPTPWAGASRAETSAAHTPRRSKAPATTVLKPCLQVRVIRRRLLLAGREHAPRRALDVLDVEHAAVLLAAGRRTADGGELARACVRRAGSRARALLWCLAGRRTANVWCLADWHERDCVTCHVSSHGAGPEYNCKFVLEESIKQRRRAFAGAVNLRCWRSHDTGRPGALRAGPKP